MVGGLCRAMVSFRTSIRRRRSFRSICAPEQIRQRANSTTPLPRRPASSPFNYLSAGRAAQAGEMRAGLASTVVGIRTGQNLSVRYDLSTFANGKGSPWNHVAVLGIVHQIELEDRHVSELVPDWPSMKQTP